MSDENWQQYKKYVLAELHRHNKHQELLAEKLKQLSITVAQLQVKASLWGAIAGSLTILAIALFKRKFHL